mmetsp:Transcript_60640/g.169449  ORF Transcript_60640/g.169449 Transcript_60640/m.169449 type:complete len:212 (+) Transcript_60640:710-1345(+)
MLRFGAGKFGTQSSLVLRRAAGHRWHADASHTFRARQTPIQGEPEQQHHRFQGQQQCATRVSTHCFAAAASPWPRQRRAFRRDAAGLRRHPHRGDAQFPVRDRAASRRRDRCRRPHARRPKHGPGLAHRCWHRGLCCRQPSSPRLRTALGGQELHVSGEHGAAASDPRRFFEWRERLWEQVRRAASLRLDSHLWAQGEQRRTYGVGKAHHA